MILGVTGAFGSGKSTVMRFFAAANWQIFDADEECRAIYSDPDDAFRSAVAARWGEEVFDAGGAVSSKAAAAKIFTGAAEREFWLGLVYPRLYARLERSIDSARSARCNAAYEFPLLFEAGLERYFDAVLMVWAAPELRRQRLRERRGFDPAEIARREALQMEPDRKLELADYALINNGSEKLLQMQFDELLRVFQDGEAKRK